MFEMDESDGGVTVEARESSIGAGLGMAPFLEKCSLIAVRSKMVRNEETKKPRDYGILTGNVKKRQKEM